MIVDKQDFEFLFSWLDLDGLLQRARYQDTDRAIVDAVLELAQQIGETELATHLRKGDLQEPQIDPTGAVRLLPDVAKGVEKMAEAGFFGMIFDEAHGGLQMPHIVYVASLGILMSANVGTASFLLLTVANARLLVTHGSEKQLSAFAAPQIAGLATGTMCLSEPHAGSSLADIRTRAVLEGSDDWGSRYRLSGSKMWISGGDHDATENIVHLVLAKVPDAQGQIGSGTKNISLFAVPKLLPGGERNDVAVAGLNHKMGYRSIPNCALNFGEGRQRPAGRAGAVGWLVGKAGQGLPQMFQMMNEARVSVGLAGAMLAVRGYQMSRDYARERTQGRLVGKPGGPQVAIIEHPDVKRMLLAQKAFAQGALGLVLLSARLLDDEKTLASEEERAEAASLLALLTPATKTWPSEWAQVSLHHALQIHGGAGYTRDFEIEQLYRDNRLNPIHEGTTGIQGIDLVGRKLRRDKGRAFSLLKSRVEAVIREGLGEPMLRPMAEALAETLELLDDVVAGLVCEADEAIALSHGTPVLFAFGHFVVAWVWLEQTIHASRLLQDRAERFSAVFLDGRIRTARYYFDVELPKIPAWLAAVRSGSDVVIKAHVEEF